MAPPVSGPASATRTIFFGSGSFAVPILEVLTGRPDIEIVGVVTPPDRRVSAKEATGPGPVAAAARAAGLLLLQVPRVRAETAVAGIRALGPDLGILADFGQLIPPVILEMPKHGILNVHPSLLPRHRGATPIPATILAGDTVAGVSIMYMDAGLDTGPIAASRSWPLDGSEDSPQLEQRAALEGSALLVEVLDAVLAGAQDRAPQDPSTATMTRPLVREAGRLDARRSAMELDRQVRAMRPWPGSFLEVGGLRLLIHEVSVGSSLPGDVPGMLVADGEGLALATADGRLHLTTVQPAGGRSMPGTAFLRGRRSVIGLIAEPGPGPESVSCVSP